MKNESFVASSGGEPHRPDLASEVHLQLRMLIMDSTIPPGSRINIEDAARQLLVSATPVREALARLESEGLVIKIPLRGYRTTELLTRTEIEELYELRLLLEPNAAAAAALHAGPEVIERLLRELTSHAGAVATISPTELSNHDAKLHELVFQAAGNRLISDVYARTHCHLHIFRLAYSGAFGPHTIEEHDRVVQAITSKDPVSAFAAMQEHIQTSRDRVLAQYDQRPIKAAPTLFRPIR